MQAKSLACYSFTDAGRRHETQGSETKDLITHSTAVNRISALAPVPYAPVPTRQSEESQVTPAHTVVVSKRGV